MSVFTNHAYAWVFAALALAGVTAALWFYRLVPPTVRGPLRYLLATLRAAALVLLCLALAEPVLSLTRVTTEHPVVAVLIDDSSSMATPDGTNGARRGDEAVTLVNEVVLPRLAHDADVVAYSFSAVASPLTVERGVVSPPAALDGRVTDVASAFDLVAEELSGRNLQAVVLATDGASNVGGSLYDSGVALGVPVFALGLGSQAPAADIAVREVRTNRISYEGESVPVEVRLSSVGFDGSEATVELREAGALLDSRPVVLSGSGEERVVTFSVVPDGPGVHRYSVSVPPVHGEFTPANNSRVAVTTSFKGRLKVLLAAARPSWDYAFLRRHFEADRNTELVAAVRVDGAAPGAVSPLPASFEELAAYDLVVLVGGWAEPLVRGDWLAEHVGGRGGGLLIVGVPAEAPTGRFAELVPVSTSPGGDAGASRTVESRLILTPSGESSATMRIETNRAANAGLWRSLPPVWVAAAGLRAKAGAEELAVADGSGGVPVIVSGRFGAGSVMVVAAEGVWRWKMGADVEGDPYDRFFGAAARWLTARGELARVVAETDRDVYAAGESVRLTAQVYGEDYRPRAGASVGAGVSTARGAAPLREVSLMPDGDSYTASFGSLPPGDYVYDVTASVSGEEMGTAAGEFVVEQFSLEDAETRMRPAVLERLAEDTGGAFFQPATLDAVPEGVPMEWARRTSTRELELWNSPWLLLAAVGLLTAEWALRRKKGLP